MRSRRVGTIHAVASGAVVADWVFTTPAGITRPLSGLWLIHLQGYGPTEPWRVVTYALYLLVFACWAPVLYLPIRIRDLAAAMLRDGTALPDAARRAYRVWVALGWPAFAALTAVLWLMVAGLMLW